MWWGDCCLSLANQDGWEIWGDQGGGWVIVYWKLKKVELGNMGNWETGLKL